MEKFVSPLSISEYTEGKLFYKDTNGYIVELPLRIKNIVLQDSARQQMKILIEGVPNGFFLYNKSETPTSSFSEEEWDDIMKKLKETL